MTELPQTFPPLESVSWLDPALVILIVGHSSTMTIRTLEGQDLLLSDPGGYTAHRRVTHEVVGRERTCSSGALPSLVSEGGVSRVLYVHSSWMHLKT